MAIALERGENMVEIALGGSVEIESARELKATLLEALEEKKKLAFSFSPDTELDVTAVQLLWAAGHEATKRGIELEFRNPPARITALVREAGFEPFLSVPL